MDREQWRSVSVASHETGQADFDQVVRPLNAGSMTVLREQRLADSRQIHENLKLLGDVAEWSKAPVC